MLPDYHAILGISSSASEQEIKRAYRKLAMQYHPDRNKTQEAKEQFIAIQDAYHALITSPTEPLMTEEVHITYERALKSDKKYEALKTYGFLFAFICTSTLLGLALYFWGTRYKITQAWEAYQNRNYAEAKTHLMHVLESDVSHKDANILMAKILVEQKAASSLIFALPASEASQRADVLTCLSLSYLLNQDTFSAQSVLYQALYLNENYDSANMLLGYLLFLTGDQQQAKQYFTKVKEKEKYVSLMEYIRF